MTIVAALKKLFQHFPPTKLENLTWKDVIYLPDRGLLVGTVLVSDPTVQIAVYRLASLSYSPGALVPRAPELNPEPGARSRRADDAALSASLMRACVRADVTDAHFDVVRRLDSAWDTAGSATPEIRAQVMRRVVYGTCTPNNARRAIVKYGGVPDAPVLDERGPRRRNRPQGVDVLEEDYLFRLQAKHPKSWRSTRSVLRRLLRSSLEERDRLLAAHSAHRSAWRSYMEWRELRGLGALDAHGAERRIGAKGAVKRPAPREVSEEPVKGRHRVVPHDDGTLTPLLSVREVAVGALGRVEVEPTDAARTLIGAVTDRDTSEDLFPEHAGYFEAWMREVHGSSAASARVEAGRLLRAMASLRPFVREDRSIAPVALAVRIRLLPPSYRWAWNLYVRALAEADLPGPRATILPWAPRSERLMPRKYEEACVAALRWAASRGFKLQRFLSATGAHVRLSGTTPLFTLMRDDRRKPAGKNAVLGYPLDAATVRVFHALLQWRNATGFHVEYDARHDGAPALSPDAPLFVVYPNLGYPIPLRWWEKLIARHLTPAEAAILAGEKPPAVVDTAPAPAPAMPPQPPAGPSKRALARKRHAEREAKKRAEWEAEVAETLQQRVDYLARVRGESLTNPFQDTDEDDGGSRG